MKRYEKYKKLGYKLLDTGYEYYNDRLCELKDKGYDCEGCYVKTDTKGLRMWEIWGKENELD